MQKIKKYLQKICKSKLALNLGIVFSENIITKGINFVIIIILSRLLGPSDYGKYSFIFVSMAFCSALFDFGMENTAVRFSNKDKTTKNSIFGLYFMAKSIILTFVLITIIFFGEKIFIVLNKKEIIEYIPYLVIGIIGESLFFVNDTYLQAKQEYKLRATINISRYALSLIFIIVLFFNKLILLKYVFYIYFIPLAISLLFVIKYINFLKVYYQQKLNKNLLLEIINYEKWMLNLSVGNNILGRIDFFMLSFWVSYTQIGIYNAAFQLSCIFSFLPYVFGKVILPKMSELNSQGVYDFTKTLFKPILAISIIMICCVPLAKWAIPMILGAEYKDCIAVLQVLLMAFIFSLLVLPFEQALYSLGKPKFIAISKYFQIAFIILLNIIMIPRYGMIWAALNMAIGRIFLAIIIIYIFIQQEKEFCSKSTINSKLNEVNINV